MSSVRWHPHTKLSNYPIIFKLTLQRCSLWHLFWPKITRASTKFAKYWEAVNPFLFPSRLQLVGEVAVVPTSSTMHTILKIIYSRLRCIIQDLRTPIHGSDSKIYDFASNVKNQKTNIRHPGSRTRDSGSVFVDAKSLPQGCNLSNQDLRSRVLDPRFGIREPGPKTTASSMPDPGSKLHRSRIQDPGSRLRNSKFTILGL